MDKMIHEPLWLRKHCFEGKLLKFQLSSVCRVKFILMILEKSPMLATNRGSISSLGPTNICLGCFNSFVFFLIYLFIPIPLSDLIFFFLTCFSSLVQDLQWKCLPLLIVGRRGLATLCWCHLYLIQNFYKKILKIKFKKKK